MKIFINNGHDAKRTIGGIPVDAGATNKTHNAYECDIVAVIGEYVRSYLYEAGHVVSVKQDDALTELCNEANSNRMDLFVSIHCNACDCNASGTECWYYPGSDKGKELADLINKEISATFPQLPNRGIKEEGVRFGVLRLTNMPSVIVECAFIDCESDYYLLVNNAREFGEAIANGIIKYCIGKGR